MAESIQIQEEGEAQKHSKGLTLGKVTYCAGSMGNLAVWKHVFLPHFISFHFTTV